MFGPLTDALGLAEAAALLALEPPGWGGNLLRGLANSITIALGAFGLGLLIGTAGAFGKLHGGPILRDVLALYTTIVRGVPELVLILILYFAFTDAVNQLLVALGRERIQISGLVAGISVLGVVQGAYATEVIRGAIEAVPKGQIEAARAFGMALLAIVGFGELTLETRQAAGSTKAYFTFFIAAGMLYLMVTLVSGWVFGRIERHARRGQPDPAGAGR
jgi:polar amino acid transport system permease protein